MTSLVVGKITGRLAQPQVVTKAAFTSRQRQIPVRETVTASSALHRWLPDGHFHAVREHQITRRYVRAASGTGKHPTKRVGSHSFPFPTMLAWLRAVGGGFTPRAARRAA